MTSERVNEKITKLWLELDDRVRIAFRNVDWTCLPIDNDAEPEVYLDFFGIDDDGGLAVDFFVMTRISVYDPELDDISLEDLGPLRTLAKSIHELSRSCPERTTQPDPRPQNDPSFLRRDEIVSREND